MHSFFTKFLALFFFLLFTTVSFAGVFINEVNYRAPNIPNKGIELAGTSGTNLNGWKLAFYNFDGVEIGTTNLSGIIPDITNGNGFVWIEVDQQMPSPTGGGISVIRPGNQVEQFLSFGPLATPLIAQDGLSIGLTAQHIGIQLEPEHSLQLTGTGLTYVDFVWGIPQGATRNQLNTNQTFLAKLMSVGHIQNGTQSIDSEAFKLETEKEKVLSIVAYPNPVINELRISFPEITTSLAQLNVYDTFGKLIVSQPIAEGATQATVDFESQLPGHYVILLQSKTQRVTQVIMKQ